MFNKEATMAPELRQMWQGFDGQANTNSMRVLALDLMRDNYRAADNAAKRGALKQAEQHLESAERWRVKARSHGAVV